MFGFHISSCNCRLAMTARLDVSLNRATRTLFRVIQQQQHGKFSCIASTDRSPKDICRKNSRSVLILGQPLPHYEVHQLKRWESTKAKPKGLVKAIENPYAGLTPAQKVKEAGKDTVYTGIIVVGVGVTALMFYAIGKELLSKQSPSGVYGQALKLCKQNTEIIAALGEPIKGYGETSRRGRRRHVSHAEFDANGAHHMRMKFYVEGPYKKGTVQLEVSQRDGGKYEYRYLYVELDGYPHRRIILHGNR